LIFVYGKTEGPSAYGYPVYPAPFIEEVNLSPLRIRHLFMIKSLSTNQVFKAHNNTIKGTCDKPTARGLPRKMLKALC
jgi:hypothetical protein